MRSDMAMATARRRGLAALAGLALAMASGSTASAQVYTPSFELDTYHPAASPFGIYSLERPRHMDLGEFGVGAEFFLTGPMLRACDMAASSCLPADDIGPVIKNRIGGTLRAALGLRYLELGVTLPAIFFQNGDLDPDGSESLSTAGVGDLRISAKSSLFADGPVGIGLVLAFAAPTGREEDFFGGPGIGLEARLLAEVRFWRARIAVDAGFRGRTKSVDLENIHVGSEILATLGAQVDLVEDFLTLQGEIRSAISIATDGPEDVPIEGIAGLEIRPIPSIAIGVAGGGGFGPGYGAPAYRVLASIAYERTVKDTDGDGIYDNRDKCVEEPEDKDEFEDRDGCPDPDNDADGILDADDGCPLKPETVNGFDDEDGCPDEVPDTDGDGIVDPVDACPTEPETVNGVDDEDGCPDSVDRDGDGIPDDSDACPDEPEDADGFEDDDGCPEPDNDKDGVLDADDKCPDDPEDIDFFDDEDGCPEWDNDKDGINDDVDECPSEPETINGIDDEDGCPDKGKVLVKVTRDRILILEKVFFATGKSTIKKKSFKLLSQVATAMKHHAEITLLRVEGHTDSRGSKAMNMKLSASRAASVKTHLVEVHGIDPARLVTEGFGPTRPVSDKHADNRRVEFVVVEIDGEAIGPEPATDAAEPPTDAPAGSKGIDLMFPSMGEEGIEILAVPDDEAPATAPATAPTAKKKRKKKKGSKKGKRKKARAETEPGE